MKNLSQMMKQAQEMQSKMADMQNQLGEIEVTGQSGAGMIVATMNGRGEMRGIKIDKSLIDPEDPEVLEDLVVAAINDAKGKVEVRVQEETQKVMGDMKLPPGMKLPF
jgi:nucleoid-associated protein EbfC